MNKRTHFRDGSPRRVVFRGIGGSSLMIRRSAKTKSIFIDAIGATGKHVQLVLRRRDVIETMIAVADDIDPDVAAQLRSMPEVVNGLSRAKPRAKRAASRTVN